MHTVAFALDLGDTYLGIVGIINHRYIAMHYQAMWLDFGNQPAC